VTKGIAMLSRQTLLAGSLLAAAVCTAGALTATGALAADATPGTPTPSASATPDQKPGGKGELRRKGLRGGLKALGHGLGGGVLHGEVVVQGKDGTPETLLVQGGDVTANSDQTVTVKSTDGFTLTWTVDATSVIRSGREATKLSDVAVGDKVTVTGAKTGSGGTVKLLAERPAKDPAKDPADAPGTPRRAPAEEPSAGGSGLELPVPVPDAPDDAAPADAAPAPLGA
jgi:hypothetical protein